MAQHCRLRQCSAAERPPPLLTCSVATQPLPQPSAPAVREADLLPAVALLFRWTGQSAVDMAQVPALRPELLRAAKPATVTY